MAQVKLEDRLSVYLSDLTYNQHTRLTLSPSSRLFALTLPGTVPILFNLSSKSKIPLPPHLRADQIIFSPDETCIYLRNNTAIMKLLAPFSLATPLVQYDLSNNLSHALLTPDGQTLVYTNSYDFYLVDLQTEEQRRSRVSFKGNCNSTIFSFDAASNYMVSASEKCIICKFDWRVDGGNFLMMFRDLSKLNCNS